MAEKEPVVGSTDYGKDEDSAEVGGAATGADVYVSAHPCLFRHY